MLAFVFTARAKKRGRENEREEVAIHVITFIDVRYGKRGRVFFLCLTSELFS
jgi:hypothetical protein